MSTTQEKIQEIEEELRRTKVNKATESHVGRLKAKLAKLKRQQQEQILAKSGKGGSGYDIKKSGDSSVALIGLPSVGKSTLMGRLTNKESKTGKYAFTTLEAIPGIMEYEGTQVQIIDLPGIISGASKGKGRGKQVLGVARSADLILVVLDVFEAETHMRLILEELYHFGIRLDQEKPDIEIEKTRSGGIAIASIKQLTKIDEKTIKAIMHEYKIINANVTIRTDIDADQLIDVLEGNRVYIPSVVVANKVDLATPEMIEELKQKMRIDLFISAETNYNMLELKKVLFEKLNLIRIYLKPYGQQPDYEEPLIMKAGCTVKDVCNKLHRNLVKEFKFARVWGKSAKHEGQRVMLNHVLQDEDVLTIIKSRN